MVDYGLLTHYLANVSVGGAALKWLSTFLPDQGQRVELGESVSNKHPLIYGVLQEAILSAMLFNVYVYPPPPAEQHNIP